MSAGCSASQIVSVEISVKDLSCVELEAVRPGEVKFSWEQK
jgi:hypothetical protein